MLILLKEMEVFTKQKKKKFKSVYKKNKERQEEEKRNFDKLCTWQRKEGEKKKKDVKKTLRKSVLFQ